MRLTVFERANILNILPKEGNFKTLRTIVKLRELVSLSDEENIMWQVKFEDDGRMKWRINDENGNPIPQEADVDISESGIELIAEILKKLEGANKLKLEHYTLYEKFCINVT